MVTRLSYCLVAALFLATVFSPFVQTAGEPDSIPADKLNQVDLRLQLVYQNPSRADELGLSPAEPGMINLVARVSSLDNSHHVFVQELGGVVTSSFDRFNTFCFVISINMVPNVTQLPGLIWLEADVLFYPSLDNSCLLYTSPSPRDKRQSRMPSSA